MIEFDFSDEPTDSAGPADHPSELEQWADEQLSRKLHDPSGVVDEADTDPWGDLLDEILAEPATLDYSPGEAERAIEASRVRRGEQHDPFGVRQWHSHTLVQGGMIDDGLIRGRPY